MTAQEQECDCAPRTCQPERNEGRYCWRSQQSIPVGYYAARLEAEIHPKHEPPSAAEVAQAEKELRQIRREYAQQEKQR